MNNSLTEQIEALLYETSMSIDERHLAVEAITQLIHQALAEARWAFAQELANSNNWRVLIEDELTALSEPSKEKNTDGK